MTVLDRGDLLPEIVVPPPGPESRRLSAALARHEAPGINTLGPRDEPTIVWAEACGSNVVDVDGNRYVDLTSGFGVAILGHRPPEVVSAVARQAGQLLHGLGDVAAHPARIELARRLAALAPVDDPVTQLAISGADAIELALKVALAATGRPGILAFEPSYHGVTLGALAASSRAEFRAPFAAHLSPHVVRLPYAAPIERLREALAGGTIGAVVVEPLVGREGVLVPPTGWLAALAREARAHGAFVVADEIFTGFFRTGARFAVELEGVRPDLLALGKALGGGMPLAALVGRRALFEPLRTGGEALHTATFVAHPLACAAALAALDRFGQPGFARRVDELGRRLAAGLGELCRSAGLELCGRGLVWGIVLKDAPGAQLAAHRARAEGVLLLAGGADHRVLQIAPAATLTDGQLAAAIEIVARALPSAP